MTGRLLDLYCGQGGASMGYRLAGFVVEGVDDEPQPRYPFVFHQRDALEFLAEHGHEYDAVHASPPCPRYAKVTKWRGKQADHPDLLGPTRDALVALGLPWVIENVPGAPMRPDLVLCGTQFGLDVERHRWFETSWPVFALQHPCNHDGDELPFMHKGERAFRLAMGCHWMNNLGGRQAVPPAYTKFVGGLLVDHLNARAAS